MKTLKTLVLIGLVVPAASCASDSAPPRATPVLSYPPVEAETLTSLQSQVVDITFAVATAQGLVIDTECMRSVGAQLTEQDAALIANAKAGDSVQLSAQGSQLPFAMRRCVRAPDVTTTTTIGE